MLDDNGYCGMWQAGVDQHKRRSSTPLQKGRRTHQPTTESIKQINSSTSAQKQRHSRPVALLLRVGALIIRIGFRGFLVLAFVAIV